MPVYIYRCLNCRVKFDRIQLFSDKSLTRCPKCHRCTVRRIPQLPAVIFKGPGWYSIDHRSPSDQKISSVVKKNDKAGSTFGEANEG